MGESKDEFPGINPEFGVPTTERITTPELVAAFDGFLDGLRSSGKSDEEIADILNRIAREIVSDAHSRAKMTAWYESLPSYSVNADGKASYIDEQGDMYCVSPDGVVWLWQKNGSSVIYSYPDDPGIEA